MTPWTAACQAYLSITSSWSLLKLVSIESVMPSNHLILCRPFLLLPSICPSIRVFSNESVLHIRWPKYWSLSFSISPSNEHSGLISFRTEISFRIERGGWEHLFLKSRERREQHCLSAPPYCLPIPPAKWQGWGLNPGRLQNLST